MLKFTALIFVSLFSSTVLSAQEKPAEAKAKPVETKTVKKANKRPVETVKVELFEKATVAEMAAQCVKFETEAGAIEMEMFPESAPESVRGFLNMTASGALETTTFSRVVPGFVIQGGDLFTREKMTAEFDKRARKLLPDEPNQIKHERGIVSMARSDEPNTTSTHFFILLSEARMLDGKFAAFGRVTKGMETVEAINKMSVEGEKPVKPIKINRAAAAPCAVPVKL